VVKTCSTEVSK